MSQITKEQARRLRNDFECWQQDYDPKEDKEQYDMFGRGMAAMDMLIAGMYQEPVAWDYEWASYVTCEGPQGFERVIEREAPPEWAIDDGRVRDIIPLYRHPQPVPVAPNEWTIFNAVSFVAEYQPPSQEEAALFAWNACRAAMLQGVDGIRN